MKKAKVAEPEPGSDSEPDELALPLDAGAAYRALVGSLGGAAVKQLEEVSVASLNSLSRHVQHSVAAHFIWVLHFLSEPYF